MADKPITRMQLRLDPPPQEDLTRTEQFFKRMTQTTMQGMNRMGDRTNADKTVMSSMIVGSNRDRKSGSGLSPRMMSRVRKSMRDMSRTMRPVMQGIFPPSLFRPMEKGWHKVTAAIKKTHDVSKKLAATAKQLSSSLGGAAKKAGGFAKGVSSRAGRMGRAGLRAGMRGASFIGGSLIGFITSALREAFGAYEAQARSQLQARATLGSGARFFGGTQYGFTRAQGAGIQGQAGRAGITQGTQAGADAAFQIMRVLGSEGLQFGGGIMARNNMRGSAGVKGMMRELSKSMALAMETGLDRARLPEFLQAANQLAEEQIRVSPGKDLYNNFAQELARFQLGGVQGKYAQAALQRAGGAIRGASGAAQATLMRAFGFGKGAGLIDVLKRQELGAGGGNIQAIMAQLMQEYGTGPGGGLSAAGKLAFKGMGMGGIHMAEKFSQIHLQQKAGLITGAQAQTQIEQIQEKQKLSGKSKLEIEALKAMKGVGGIVKMFAGRTDRMAKVGAENVSILKSIDKMQRAAIKASKGIFNSLSKVMPKIASVVTKVLPYIGKAINLVVSGISLIVEFIKGMWKGKKDATWYKPWTYLTKPFSSGMEALQKEADKQGLFKTKNVGVKGYYGDPNKKGKSSEADSDKRHRPADGSKVDLKLSQRIIVPALPGNSSKATIESQIDQGKGNLGLKVAPSGLA